MTRKHLLATTAGMVLGAMLSAGPAFADLPTIDAITHFLLQQAQNMITTAVTNVEKSVTNIGSLIGDKVTDMGNLIGDKLTAGFTQSANYAKASIGAQEQIADASNTVMARNARDLRNAQIRDEHIVTPQACAALDDGQTIAVSAGQSWRVSNGISDITDKRSQGRPDTPAWAGQGQATAAANQLHLSRYCSQNEQQAGLCSTWNKKTENSDQSSTSLFGRFSYTDQDGINSANDYARTLIEPVPPAALRGAQLASVAGQEAAAKRRGYNAQMSLVNGVLNDIIASRTSSVVLTSGQKQQLQAQGLPAAETASWVQAQDLEVNRRISGVAWHAGLQGMPQKSVLVEIASEQAMTNYILWQIFGVLQKSGAVEAAQLAATATANLRAAPAIPTPQMAPQ